MILPEAVVYGNPTAPFHALVLAIDHAASGPLPSERKPRPRPPRRRARLHAPVVVEAPRFPDVPSGLGRIEAPPFDPDKARARAAWSI